jgi:hypothetical protein
MIQKSSTVILRTVNAIYSPCKIVALNDESITVKFFAGMKKDRKTGKMYEDHQIETIPRNKITSLQERT